MSSQAIQQRGPEGTKSLTGSFHDARAITARLEDASKRYHLVSPATTAPNIPEGCDVVISQVIVDQETETYEIVKGKQYGLSKTALQKVAAAAGVSWDSRLSGRTDDGSDPHYCSWTAVGYVRHFDGTISTITASKEMDLREGSAQVEGMFERYRAALAAYNKGNSRYKYAPKDPTNQIREMRLHIAQHAETKAQLRAIRSLGLRSSYSPKELEKPFVIARLMFTGRSEDPDLKRMFAEKQADAMLGGMRTLYGDSAPRQLTAPARHAPPPVGSTNAEPEDIYEPSDSRAIDTTGEASCGASSTASNQDVDPAEFKVPGGREKGAALPDASDNTIGYWRDRIESSLNEGTSRYPDADTKLLAALQVEASRRGLDGPPPEQSGQGTEGEQPEFSLEG